jgi:hypothetical protein
LEFLARVLRYEQEIKVIQIGKEEIKPSLFAEHDPIPKRPKKLVEIINSFSKVSGYKINTQKSVAFLNANNTQTEKEIRVTILFTIASKAIKYSGINLTKETKDLF